MPPLTLTVSEVALALNLSKPLVYNELNRKDSDRIPHFRIGRRIVIPKDSFLDWMAKKAKSENPENQDELDGQMSLFDSD